MVDTIGFRNYFSLSSLHELNMLEELFLIYSTISKKEYLCFSSEIAEWSFNNWTEFG